MAAFATAPSLLGAHPADTTEDGRISLEEMTAYTAAWQNGETWSDGSPVAEDAALRAIYIWRSGERYREIDGAPLPFAWVPDPEDATYLGLGGLRAEPLDVVELFDLPVDVDTVSGVFTVLGQEGEFTARLDRTEDGAPALVVPFNPYDPLGSGQLDFTLTDGESTWQVGPIELQPLPEAPGEMLHTRNDVVSWIEDFGASVGADISALLDEPINEVPAAVLPLVALLHEIKGPDVADNLDALLDDTAPSLQGEALELDLYERVLAKLNARALLPEPAQAATQANALMSAMAIPASDGEQPYHQVEIEDGVELAELMRQQATAERTLEALTKTNDVISDLSENLDEADGVLDGLESLDKLGAIELGDDKRENIERGRKRIGTASRATSYVGWFVEAVKFINYYNNGILPNRFLSMSVAVTGPNSQAYSVEDNCAPADVSARVDVTSQPLTYGAEYSSLPDHLQGLNLPDILPSIGVSGEVGGVPGQVTFRPTGVSFEAEWVPEFVWTGIELAIGNFDNTELLVSVTVVEPDFPFAPHEKTDGPGDAGRVIGSEIRPDPDLYTGEIGPGTVHVSAKADHFGGKTIQQTATYGLRALNPLIIEHPSRIEPGDPTQLRAEIANASSFGNEFIEWEVTDRNGAPVNTFIEDEESGEVYLLDLYETPTDEEVYPLQVVFRSATTECLRGSDQAPPRESRVFVRVTDIGFRITPGVDCLLDGEERVFAAEWPGGEIPEDIDAVTWSIEEGGGELVETGPFTATYTAPASSGAVTIRAEAVDDASAFATQSFTVNCNFSADFAFERNEQYLPSTGTAQPERFNFNFFEGAFTGFYDDWIPGAVKMTFDEVVAIGENQSRAIGSFAGVGLVYGPSDVSTALWTFAYQTDDSGNRVEYPRPDEPHRVYEVSAAIAIANNTSPSRNMRIDEGGLLEIDFSGRFSNSREGDMGYVWNASSGSSGTGESATLRYPMAAGTHWVELIVTDPAGNTARQLKRFSLVEIEGSFSFAFLDDRGIASDPPPDANLPGNFLEATTTGPFAGTFAHGGFTGISAGLIGVDLYRFQVRYHPTSN